MPCGTAHPFKMLDARIVPSYIYKVSTYKKYGNYLYAGWLNNVVLFKQYSNKVRLLSLYTDSLNLFGSVLVMTGYLGSNLCSSHTSMNMRLVYIFVVFYILKKHWQWATLGYTDTGSKVFWVSRSILWRKQISN